MKAVEMTFGFFCFQVFSSSLANIIGTVLGHPFDTIRVSQSINQSEDFKSDGEHDQQPGILVLNLTSYKSIRTYSSRRFIEI